MNNKMRRKFLSLSLFLFWLPATYSAGLSIGEFEEASLSVVFSASDVDAQIIIGGGSDLPLKHVVVFGPAGVKPVNVRFKDGNRLGQADFQFDTPEPSLQDLKKAYPEGNYTFLGKTTGGQLLRNTVVLSYDLLEAPDIIFPVDGDVSIPVDGLIVLWDEIDDADSIRLEIENELTENALKVDLPGNATSFNVPNNWLQSGIEYVLDIKAKGANGNVTVTDLRFTTMK